MHPTAPGPSHSGSDAEHVWEGAHLAPGVAPIVPTEIGVAREPKRRLSDEEIRTIRGARESGVALSRQYGVSATSIYRIRRRRAQSSKAS